jgi:hypothetical protein
MWMKSRQRLSPGQSVETLECRVLLSSSLTVIPFARPTYQLVAPHGTTHASTTSPTGLAPTQVRTAYGLSGISGSGAGQTIAIIDAYDDPNIVSDLASFDAYFNLPAPPSFTKLNEQGGTSLPSTDSATKPNTWELEESLDVEWAHVIAPQASIILYEAKTASLPDLIGNAVNSARNNPSVSVIAMSFGAGEYAGEDSFDNYFTTPAGHGGVTFVASTGDSGSPGTYPAFSPNVVAVGGTYLSVDSSGNWLSESAWSSSGGGTSTQETEPGYQNSVQSTGHRTIPDVAMDASPASGVPVFDTFDNGASAPWIQVGGTSLAAPMWAALIAVTDQGRAANSLTSLDGPTQTLPLLYGAPQSTFHDITSGSDGSFSAGPGYDEVTGLGSPIAGSVTAALGGAASTPSSVSLYPASAAPAASLQNVNDPTIAADGGVELGMKFQSDTAGTVTGVRFWKGSLNTGPHTGELWSSTGTLLATATFTSESTSGWQQVNFSNPVTITADTTYLVSYHTTAPYIAYTANVFSNSGIDNAPLHALVDGADGDNAVYHYDTAPGVSTFPTQYNGQAPSYWVDVVFTASSANTGSGTASIFAASSAPAASWQNVSDPTIVQSGGVELGMKFRSDTAGSITGVRFWKGSLDTGPHTGELWTSTGTLLATVNFTNETASGWQQANFSNPVAIAANTTYIISYHTAAGYIAYTPGVFANSGIDNNNLHALASGVDGNNSVYAYDAAPGVSAFPANYNGQAPSYWVDVVFSAG